MSTETELITNINDAFQIKLFGKIISDLQVSATKSSVLQKNLKDKLVTVQLFGIKAGNRCIKFPKPFITLLPGTGSQPAGCDDFGDPNEYLMWIIGRDQEFVKISMEADSIENIMKTELAYPTRSIDADFHFHDVRLDGTHITGRFRAYLMVDLGLGKWVIIDNDIPFSFNLPAGQCLPIPGLSLSVGFATIGAKACFYANPNRLCGEVGISISYDMPWPIPDIKWGQSFSIACVNL